MPAAFPRGPVAQAIGSFHLRAFISRSFLCRAENPDAAGGRKRKMPDEAISLDQ